MPQWTADRPLDAAFAERRIAASFPELAGARVKLLAEGWDNAIFLVNDDLAFRFPRRAVAVPLLERECSVLPRLAPHLPLAVPEPHYLGQPAADDPWPFYGHRLLAGHSLASLRLDDDGRLRLAEPLGRFLRVLHRQGKALMAGLELPGDELRRLDRDKRIPQIQARLQQLGQAGWLDDISVYDRILGDVPALPADAPSCLVHGDLHAANLLVGADARPSGVIDWGDVHLGHPAVDLAIAFALPPAARRAFCQAYGPIGEVSWRLARLRALHMAALLLDYALETGRETLAWEARRGLELVRVG